VTTTGPVVNVLPWAKNGPRAVTLGVPFPRGWIDDSARLAAHVQGGESALALQGRVLARWPDGSIKWLLTDLLLPAALAGGGTAVALSRRSDASGAAQAACEAGATLAVESAAGRVECRTDLSRVVFSAGADRLADLDRMPTASDSKPSAQVLLVFTDTEGRRHPARVEAVSIEESGSVRVTVVQHGGFGADCPLEFLARWSVAAGTGTAVLDLRIRNPRAALHAGGLWDLGDPGSVLIGDLSCEVAPAAPVMAIEWRVGPDAPLERTRSGRWSLYQDSSGGDRWDSPNHTDADGRLGVSFKGYVVRQGGDGGGNRDAGTGLRAQPAVAALGPAGRVAMSVRDFWQNFPKALRFGDGRLSAALFPRERVRPTELQGGEQRRHRIALCVGDDSLEQCESALEPPHAWVDPAWVEGTQAIYGFVSDLSTCRSWNDHVRTIVDGPEPFVERRERIDEFGWRHFGELWADHEAVFDTGSEPFVSHYNNQYDFVFGATVHAIRTGDRRWARLAREAAEHTTDIDIYHTVGDRAAFNGGLFWHTDHYLPARTSTHRTYSTANASGRDYGLLLHHFQTGDRDALEAVTGLAEWVIAMDDGSRTLLGIVDPGSTGLASRTTDLWYHGPGRGAGNSISTLLDAYAATRERRYMAKVEELLQRCVHPADDIAARTLDNLDIRWSYLVFLQALGKFLAVKEEHDERDYFFHYARQSLLHYADWMLGNESPYKDVFHRLELPTETWPAHDMRKCHVMHLAARYDDRGLHDTFRERARFFHDRSLEDLEAFPTRHLTRPLVILSVYGHLHRYFDRPAESAAAAPGRWRHGYQFGRPAEFVRQRDRIGTTLRHRLGVLRAELTRLMRDRLGRRRKAAVARSTTP
jgi:hypothetical protein